VWAPEWALQWDAYWYACVLQWVSPPSSQHGAAQTVAAVEACRLEEKFERLMMERRRVMKEFSMARASAALTVATVEDSRLEEKFERLMMERRCAMQEFVRARAVSAAQTRLEDKWESLIMESRRVMEESVRYRAIEALTAEESIRIRENYPRCELPRLDTTRVTMGWGGSGTATETEAGTHMDLGSQVSWEKVQSVIESSSATKSQDSDSVLMALAEKFQLPVNRPNMMCRTSTYNKRPMMARDVRCQRITFSSPKCA